MAWSKQQGEEPAGFLEHWRVGRAGALRANSAVEGGLAPYCPGRQQLTPRPLHPAASSFFCARLPFT